MMLCGNRRESIALIAVALKVALRDQPEDAGEAARDVRVLSHIGGLEQVLRDLLAARETAERDVSKASR